jgi:histidinol-phosphate aminotransferase
MISALDLVCPNVRALPAYEAAPAPEQIAAEISKPLILLLKLDANENPYGALPEVKEALGKMDRVNVYPIPKAAGFGRNWRNIIEFLRAAS